MNKNKKNLKIALQHIIPHHPYSRLIGWLTHCNWIWLKNYLMGLFIRRYQVDMNDAVITNPYQYKNFNDFFTRALRDETRPMSSDPRVIASPVDGAVIECLNIESQNKPDNIRVKGMEFNILQLVGGNKERASLFEGGDLISFYLAPKDYHRIHMPITGKLREMTYIPGKLFSVNPLTTQYIPNVLARNERVVSIFDTEVGPMAVILVGAMLVASMETVWAGIVTPSDQPGIQTWQYGKQQQSVLQRGEEMGRFQFGSTVVLVFGSNVIQWKETMQTNQPVRLREAIGTLLKEKINSETVNA